MTAFDALLRERRLNRGAAALRLRAFGREGAAPTPVAILPSLGRGGDDFTERFGATLVTRLVEAGRTVLLIDPRGFEADDPGPEPTLDEFAADVVAALDAAGAATADLIGHAYGNRLARLVAARWPARVERLIVMAAGGAFAMSEEQRTTLARCFDLSLPDTERLAALARAFFAAGNDPRLWLEGWRPAVARAQKRAMEAADGAAFKRAGGKPFLLIQPAEDFIAPPDLAGRALKAELGDQVTYVEIAGAGHALVCEQPEAVAAAVLDYLARPA